MISMRTNDKYGTSVTGFQIHTTKRAAQAFAKSHGWNNSDVTPVYHRHFGWKGWVVGQRIIDTYRGFAPDGSIVEAQIEEIPYTPK